MCGTIRKLLIRQADVEQALKLRFVSKEFEGKPLLQRHRLVNDALKEEISQIHAFTLVSSSFLFSSFLFLHDLFIYLFIYYLKTKQKQKQKQKQNNKILTIIQLTLENLDS